MTRIIATGSPARYKQVIDEEGNEVVTFAFQPTENN